MVMKPVLEVVLCADCLREAMTVHGWIPDLHDNGLSALATATGPTRTMQWLACMASPTQLDLVEPSSRVLEVDILCYNNHVIHAYKYNWIHEKLVKP